MAKAFILSICFLLVSICSYSCLSVYNSDSIKYEQKANLAVEIADTFIGIKEIGNNAGFNNPDFEYMMKKIGWYKSAAWCAYALKLIYKLAEIPNTITGWSPSAYNKKHVIYTDGKLYKLIKPGDAGTLSYNKFKSDKNRYKGIGHAFIIKAVKGNAVITIEGNTDSNAGREGNGMYEKIRPLQSNLHITRWDIK